jgi:PIN domain nuclease of toxin-antitoxin system
VAHRVLDGLGAQELTIGSREALQAGSWAVTHRDPFDHLLAAQALLVDVELARTDAIFSSFEGVRVRSG